jgi:hypothetical protein
MIKLILGLAFPVFIGYSLLSLLFKDKDSFFPIEKFAYSWGIGAGILTIEMFLFSKIGIKYSVTSIVLPNAIVFLPMAIYALIKNQVASDLAGALLFFEKIFSREGLKNGKFGLFLEKALIIALALKLFYVFFESLLKPVVAWDAFAHWSLAAKVFYVERTIPGFLSKMGAAANHPNNQLSPLLQTWIYFSIGQWNEIISKIIFPIFFACMLIIFYYAVRREASRLRSLLFTFFLSSLQLLVYHAATEYSDLLVSFYSFAGVCMLLLFFKKPAINLLATSILLLIISPFAKNEGLIYLLTSFAVLAGFVLTNKDIQLKFGRTRLIAITISCAIVMLGFLVAYIMFFSQNEAGKINGIHLQRVPSIIGVFLTKMYFSGNWSISWVAFVASLLYFFKNKGRSLYSYLLAIITLDLMIFATYYLVTDDGLYSYLFDGTVLSRNLLQFMPAVILFTALQLKLSYSKEGSPKVKRKGKWT